MIPRTDDGYVILEAICEAFVPKLTEDINLILKFNKTKIIT